jgi:transcriptional regulator with XRE-family HTH domain
MTEWPHPETYLQVQISTRAQHLGFSMRKLSLTAGLNETAVKAIMTGRSKSPRGDTLQAIALALRTTVQVLLGEDDAAIALASAPAQNEAIEALRERERQLATEIEEHARGSERASLRLEEVRSMLARLCRSPELDQGPPATPPPRLTGTDPPWSPFSGRGRRRRSAG